MSWFFPTGAFQTDGRRNGSYFYESSYESISNDGWTAVRRAVNNNGQVSRDGFVVGADGKTHQIDYDQLPAHSNPTLARRLNQTNATNDPSKSTRIRMPDDGANRQTTGAFEPSHVNTTPKAKKRNKTDEKDRKSSDKK